MEACARASERSTPATTLWESAPSTHDIHKSRCRRRLLPVSTHDAALIAAMYFKMTVWKLKQIPQGCEDTDTLASPASSSLLFTKPKCAIGVICATGPCKNKLRWASSIAFASSSVGFKASLPAAQRETKRGQILLAAVAWLSFVLDERN